MYSILLPLQYHVPFLSLRWWNYDIIIQTGKVLEQVKTPKACHVDPTASHMAIKAINQITECFMWPRIVKDVKAIVTYIKYHSLSDHNIGWMNYYCYLDHVTFHVHLYTQNTTCDACQQPNHQITAATLELHPVPVKVQVCTTYQCSRVVLNNNCCSSGATWWTTARILMHTHQFPIAYYSVSVCYLTVNT